MNFIAPRLFLRSWSLALTICLSGQSGKIPEPSLPGYSGFHSIWGFRKLLRWGFHYPRKAAPSELRPVDPVASGSLESSVPVRLRLQMLHLRCTCVETSEKDEISFTPQVGIRTYRTSNVFGQQRVWRKDRYLNRILVWEFQSKRKN